tara:strand:+ start:936 stop:1328 length:393 start_codon:yes stop_codon:yes gene_type:complete
MADTVSVLEIADTTGVKYVAKLTNISDGTGESLVEKITAADETFMTADGNRKIARINWSINTLNRNGGVEILWEGATNATACILSGQGVWDLRTSSNEITNNATTPTGDVLLSTKNFSNGDSYTIVIEFR